MTYLWIAIIAEVIADFLLKWAVTGGKLVFASGWLLYVIAVWFWGMALRTIPLAAGNTLFLTINIIIVAVGGVLFFKETLTGIQWIGVLLALLSVLLIGPKG